MLRRPASTLPTPRPTDRTSCPHCNGSGRTEDLVAVTDEDGNLGFQLAPCPHCHGRGWVERDAPPEPSCWLPRDAPEG